MLGLASSAIKPYNLSSTSVRNRNFKDDINRVQLEVIDVAVELLRGLGGASVRVPLEERLEGSQAKVRAELGSPSRSSQ